MNIRNVEHRLTKDDFELMARGFNNTGSPFFFKHKSKDVKIELHPRGLKLIRCNFIFAGCSVCISNVRQDVFNAVMDVAMRGDITEKKQDKNQFILVH